MKKQHSLPVTFILDYDKDSGYYASQIKEYPHVISQGKTQQKPTSRIRASQTRIIKPSNLLIHA
jgi:hypothetical protein